MSHVLCMRCHDCGREIDSSHFTFQCPGCQGFLDVVYDLDRVGRTVQRQDLLSRPANIMVKWLELLPVENPDLIPRVSLGEAPTPLLHARRLGRHLGLKHLLLKDETRFPTGTLKDRSMPLVVLKALEFGFSVVSIVSSGNAAASLGAYAARAGLRAVAFVAGEPSLKLLKCRAYHSLVVQVDAPYSEVDRLHARARAAFGWFDCNGLINPFRLEGKKTLAYEVVQDLGWQSPDIVLIPTAYGNGLISAWKGFNELEQLGWVDGRPALVAVQPQGCSPIAQAWDAGLTSTLPVVPSPTVAEAVAVADPSAGGERVLQAVRQSGGMVAAVPDELTLQAQSLLATHEGLFVEPSGALGMAGVIKLIGERKIPADAIVVVSITGTGANVPEAPVRLAPLHRLAASDNELQARLAELLEN